MLLLGARAQRQVQVERDAQAENDEPRRPRKEHDASAGIIRQNRAGAQARVGTARVVFISSSAVVASKNLAVEPERAASRWTAAPAREQIRRRYFPNVVVETHDGRRARFYDDLVRDKIVTLNMFYATCEGICVPTTANLVRVQRLLGARVGRDIFMYSLTLKPELDTPAVLRRYAREHGLQRGFSLLTGRADDLELLRRRLGFTDPDPALDADKSNHTGMLRIGNEPLQIWTACPGLGKPASIARSILSVAR
jgi:protein SCO1/2